MSGPILALREAIVTRLTGDTELATLMGGAVRIHDEPPRAIEGVYAVFWRVEARDWSTDTDSGHEQELDLIVWSVPGSARPALAAAERIVMLLDEAALVLNGHRLVNMRITTTSAERDPRSRLMRVVVRVRAVTERV